MALKLPIRPPFPPMEALSVDEIPDAPGWQYEPKWDGFRCIAFRDGKDVELQSKAGQPLERYFPDVVEALLALPARRFVLDSEIAIPVHGILSFDELLLRIHPAKSRVEKLARAHPALLIAFDLLVDAKGKSIVALPLSERRARLERFASANFGKSSRIRLSPATTDVKQARRWFERVGASLDGVIAKRIDRSYLSGERIGMFKVKKVRTADCVVGGIRYAEKERVVGSLLLGLYDAEGLLQHVGFTSSLKASDRLELTRKLGALAGSPGFTGRAPGGPSRWSTRRSSEWQPLQPKLVVEVAYDHFTQGRFRHGSRFIRWRPDKPPRQCTFDQVKQSGTGALALIETAKPKSFPRRTVPSRRKAFKPAQTKLKPHRKSSRRLEANSK